MHVVQWRVKVGGDKGYHPFPQSWRLARLLTGLSPFADQLGDRLLIFGDDELIAGRHLLD